ncbi:MAG TPA: MFS transporter, partial [Geobacteraceae bacterium]
VLAGTGIGLGYASATPAAVKWFPSEKKGLITGLVVAGFGLAPVYIAPLSRYLLAHYGIGGSFRILGTAFLIVTAVLAQFITNPATTTAGASVRPVPDEGTWCRMLRSPRFYSLYLQYAFAATAGLMIIGHLAKIVAVQSGNTLQIGFLFVALLAIFNACGRIAAGVISDHIGRMITIASVCIVQAMIMFFFSYFTTTGGFLVGSAVVGFNYGACLALFPATTADLWGTRNLGLNYGILFTSWGVGGVVGPMLAGKIADLTGAYDMAYNVAGVLLACAAVLAMISYINVSVASLEGEVTIRIKTRKKAA